MRRLSALGDTYVGAAITPPADAGGRQRSRSEICETAVPWNCRWYGFPALTDLLAPGDKRPCAEAWDLYDGCVGGAWNPNLVPGSGAGKAPALAAQPGVNYNDPKVLQAIAEGQKKNDMTAWLESIAANMRLVSGDGSKPDDPKEPGLNFMILAALAIVIGGALLAKR